MSPYNYIKLPVAAAVHFAQSSGELKTLEGPVGYQTGDALMTGVVGEHWPIRRATFESDYEPCDGYIMGQDGYYKKRELPVFARQLSETFSIVLDGERGVLKGKSGDWLVRNADGNMWIVTDDIFKISYAMLNVQNNQ